jgi:hypothetical protein
LRTPRSKLLSMTDLAHTDVTELVTIRETSARRLQRWWRFQSFAPLLKEWAKADLTMDKAKKMTFEKLVKVVQSKIVIRSIAALVTHFKLILPKVMFISALWFFLNKG